MELAGNVFSGGFGLLRMAWACLRSEVFLYYYVNRERAMEIRTSRCLRKDRSTRNSSFGEGVYLTSMYPKTGRKRSVDKNYDIKNPDFRRHFAQYKDKANFYFRFQKSDLPEVENVCQKGDVWIYRADIPLDEIPFEMEEIEAPVTLIHDDRTGARTQVIFT